ncbi:hypothetical protein similar to DUF221 family protein [Blumeria hordei DH14]|uniref:DUF221 domain protein n=1 Tax=Blumeria graminis f. sp. hordei (strain DH14) TaxID=546991 RepID=N1J9Y0_BLUG1|nr:hypothetical protein similar to DUF221 family protein [Blumeria hordei DH14]
MSNTVPENVPNTTLSGLLATLVPTLIVSIIYLGIFILLRKSQRRYYAPRTYLGALPEHERTESLPNGWFDWIAPFAKISDTCALQNQSLDAYLFLRFLKVTVLIMFVGVLITWPICLPVYATGGNGNVQLDMLSTSNIDASGNGFHKYYASFFAACIYFTFILLLITRESIFYVNLRQAYLLSPINATRTSARTVLFTSVPDKYQDESMLRKIFGASVKRIWLTRETSNLDELVQERDQIALQLEAAEISLMKIANIERKGSIDGVVVTDENDELGSLVARWVPEKTDLLTNSVLWDSTEAAQAAYLDGESEKTGSVFIEFTSQSEAQIAYQTLSHHQALQMAPKFIGISPDEIVWNSLKITWWQRMVRRVVVLGFISVLIVFWAIPVSIVGSISNVSYLMNYSELAWLRKIPNNVMGLITGLIPAVAMAILMSLVPVIMRVAAKISGEPSLARVELFTQNAYFVFQVVHVFLVATVASAATTLVKEVTDDPSSITSLLATKIPKASNFYISYLIVQGLTVASGVISQVVGFIIFKLIYKFLAKTPRSMYQKWSSLSAISWGSTLPVFTNIAVIGIVYSCIAPIVIGFGAVAMFLFYIAYRYNVLFVSNSPINTKGLIYPRALQQLLTGVYLAEFCLLGLFVISKASGPIVLMIVFIIFTVVYHLLMNKALNPLLYTLPKSLMAEESNDSETPDTNGENIEQNMDSSPVPTVRSQRDTFTRFIETYIQYDYATLRKLVPRGETNPNQLAETDAKNAYLPPSVTSKVPLLWVPRDSIGISSEEISETGKVIPITDEGATLGEDNRITWNPETSRPPIWKPKIYY